MQRMEHVSSLVILVVNKILGFNSDVQEFKQSLKSEGDKQSTLNRKLEHCELDINSVRDLIYGAKNMEKVTLYSDALIRILLFVFLHTNTYYVRLILCSEAKKRNWSPWHTFEMKSTASV